MQSLSLKKIGEDPSVGCSLTPQALLSGSLTEREALRLRVSLLLHDPMDNWAVVQPTICPSAKIGTWGQGQEAGQCLGRGFLDRCVLAGAIPEDTSICSSPPSLQDQFPSVRATPVCWA